ncbi:MAG: YdcF family protein [Granulosicoccus sp.]
MTSPVAELLQDWLLDPVALLFLLSLLASALLYANLLSSKRSRLAIGLIVSLWLTGFAVCSSPMLVNPIVASLEHQFPPNHSCEQGSHVVVLSGGIASNTADTIDFGGMSQATLARASAAWGLAMAEPKARLLIAGGGRGAISEADVVASYLNALGVESARIITDSTSLNTYENALRMRELLASEQITGPVRLITSALHMPRAARVFQKVFDGFVIEFCHIAVDRQTMPDVPLWAWAPQTTALLKFDLWLHEVVALLVYRLRGWF